MKVEAALAHEISQLGLLTESGDVPESLTTAVLSGGLELEG